MSLIKVEIVIFSFIGFMAAEMNTEVENVVDKGRHTSLYLASLDSWPQR